jgi:hypothetical protein
VTDDENTTMESYGISFETTTTFHFAGFKYQRLEDAVNYAKSNQHLLNTENGDNNSKND